MSSTHVRIRRARSCPARRALRGSRRPNASRSPSDDAPLQYGLIAEEVADVYPELVTRDKDGQVESVMYQFLAPMLLNEVQKQQRRIDEQRKTIDALALARRLDAAAQSSAGTAATGSG